MENKKVVLITLNYNQSKMTLDCVNSILKSSYSNYQLIVVDNGSTMDEYDKLRGEIDSSVIVHRVENNYGYVGGVNIGLEMASKLNADYYLIMNNDTIIDNFAVQYLVSASQNYNDKAIVSGKVYHFDQPNVLQYIGSYFSDRRYLKETYPGKNEEDIGQFDTEEERDMLDDIFWLIPDKIFRDVGYYSDNFFIYCEQGDYALRVVNRGYKLVFNPDAKIWHKGSITTGKGERYSPVVNFWRNKGGVIYLYRNIKKKHFYFTIFKTLPKMIIKNFLGLLGLRNSTNKKSEYAALIGYLYGIKWILNRKPDNGHNPFLN